MSGDDGSVRQFEEHRAHLRAVAYRMLGSLADADDAVQETWIRFHRVDPAAIENLGGWLTTVTGRICLNVLRARRARPEEPLDRLPDPVLAPADRDGGGDPEHEALLADGVGLALLVVLDTLAPAERLAFVLHDVFAMSFDEIAPLVERSPQAARQLASRARRRVRLQAPEPDAALSAQREVVDAFFAAGRTGDLERLVAVLHEDVTLRVDTGAAPVLVVTSAEQVAGRALLFADPARVVTPITVNGLAGVLVTSQGRPSAVMAFTVLAGRVAGIDAIADQERLARFTDWAR